MLSHLTTRYPFLSFDSRLNLIDANQVAIDYFTLPASWKELQLSVTHFNFKLPGDASSPKPLLDETHTLLTTKARDQAIHDWSSATPTIIAYTRNDNDELAEVYIEASETLITVHLMRLIRPPLPALSRSSTFNSAAHTAKSLYSPPTVSNEAISGIALEELYHSLTTLAIRLSEYDANELLENMPAITFSANAQGRINFFSAQWYALTGLTPEQSADADIWKGLFHEDDVDHAFASWTSSLMTGAPLDVQYRIKTVNRGWVWVVARGNCIRNSAGDIVRWVNTVTEIQALVEARQEALAMKESVNAVLLGANLALISLECSQELKVLSFDGPLLSLLDTMTAATEVIGVPLAAAWPDSVLVEQARQLLIEARGGPVHIEIDSHGLGPERNLSFRYQLVATRNALGEISSIVVVAADITALIATAKANATLQADNVELKLAEKAAKLASKLKTDFITSISHEIRTPLSIMLSITSELLDAELLPEQRALLESAQRAGEGLLEIVGSVLDIGKIESGAGALELEVDCPFTLDSVIADARLFEIPAHRKNLILEARVGSTEYYRGKLIGDPVRLRQIIANFISNSIKFSHRPKGKITLTVNQVDPLMNGNKHLSAGAEAIWISFEIRDAGIGIQSSVLPTLGKGPFRQADSSIARVYGGCGMGLYISKNLIRLMGGTFSFTSVFGQGSCVTVTIPFHKFVPTPLCSPSLILARSAPAAEIALPLASSYNILVADDNELIRGILVRTLTRKGFRVSAVTNGEEAIKAVEEGEFALVVMDREMPFVSGDAATRAIRASGRKEIRGTKIISLTASVGTRAREEVLSAGSDVFIAKPVKAQELINTIWQLLLS